MRWEGVNSSSSNMMEKALPVLPSPYFFASTIPQARQGPFKAVKPRDQHVEVFGLGIASGLMGKSEYHMNFIRSTGQPLGAHVSIGDSDGINRSRDVTPAQNNTGYRPKVPQMARVDFSPNYPITK